MERHITAPFSRETAASLKAGDYVYITGTIYTARDAAHKRMQEALDAGQPLPLDLAGNVIYYMGPSRRERDDRLDLRDLPQPVGWINMLRNCWI